MSAPLEGIRVVDFTIQAFGPRTSEYLAEMGAEVIKIESPRGGDPLRGLDVLRGVPLLVQIFFIYFGLGKVFHLDRFSAGVLAIGICYSAYLAETFRSGIAAIEKGQHEAALSLGMTRFQTLRYVVVPQAARIIIPPAANEFIASLKDSSLVSIIGMRELTRAGREYYAQYFVDFQTWLAVGILYLVMTLALSRIVALLEKKYRIHGYGVTY